MMTWVWASKSNQDEIEWKNQKFQFFDKLCVQEKERKKRPAAVQRFYLMMPKNDPKDIDVLHKNAAALNLVLV